MTRTTTGLILAASGCVGQLALEGRREKLKLLLQRVSRADVSVAGEVVGQIGHGLLLFAGFEKEDTEAQVMRMSERLLGYRVFADAAGQMNQSVREVQGELLVVSQFTLAADTQKGRRPSFSTAAVPSRAETLYQLLLTELAASGLRVASGRFGADMQVSLVNEGPVTFLLSG